MAQVGAARPAPGSARSLQSQLGMNAPRAIGISARTRDQLHAYAIWCARRTRGLLTKDEVRSVADLAMVRAWSHFDPGRGASFATYARKAVRFGVARALRREQQQRRLKDTLEERTWLAPIPAEYRGDLLVELSRTLSTLPAPEADALVRHFGAGEPLAAIAREWGRHRAWACRRVSEAVRKLVGAVRGDLERAGSAEALPLREGRADSPAC